MFNFCSLYSGSTGNCLLVQTDETKILIDAGVSQKKIMTALASFNVNIEDIDAILVTHEHSDHVQNVGSLSKRYNIPVYCNIETLNAMPVQKEKISDENRIIFTPNKKFKINDIEVQSFQIQNALILLKIWKLKILKYIHLKYLMMQQTLVVSTYFMMIKK